MAKDSFSLELTSLVNRSISLFHLLDYCTFRLNVMFYLSLLINISMGGLDQSSVCARILVQYPCSLLPHKFVFEYSLHLIEGALLELEEHGSGNATPTCSHIVGLVLLDRLHILVNVNSIVSRGPFDVVD